MKTLSYVLRSVTVALFSLSLGIVAKADGITPVDPGMDVSDPICTTSTCPGSVGASQGFQFASDASGGGVFTGTNQSSITWSSLLITFMTGSVNPALITCTSGLTGGAPYASPCAVQTDPFNSGLTDLIYSEACVSEICTTSGITNNDIFTVTLNTWPAGLVFTAFPNQNRNITSFVTLSTPEPGTLTLLGAGIVALLSKRKLWGKGDLRA